MTTTHFSFPWRLTLAVLAVALVARLLLVLSGAVSFHSDEAIVALMARHILDGARPVFFYGQAYMGSLDAWLVAGGFALFGQSVLTIRIVQSGLYLLVVLAGCVFAWRVSGNRVVLVVTGLALAIPATNTALYTTATLGGYNETLLLGTLLLILGHDIAQSAYRSWWRWALLGLLAGLGWWTNALIAVYAAPVALLLAYVFLWRRSYPLPWLLVGLALVAFVIGSAPWWVFDFTHDHAALNMFLSNRQAGEFEGIGVPYVPPGQRALGLALFGVPALVGLRFPWEAAYFLLPVGLIVLGIYGVALWRVIRNPAPPAPLPQWERGDERVRDREVSPVYGGDLEGVSAQKESITPSGRILIIAMPALMALLFVGSTFGADPTGRYFIPLALPLAVALGVLAARIESRALAYALVALVIAYQGAGQIVAAAGPVGLTTQFDLISHLPNDYDDELMAFLRDNDLQHGYTNYWVAMRIAFLSREALQYSSALPYKMDLSYNAADNRYRPYAEATRLAERVAYITSNLPELDAQIVANLAAQGVTYRLESIGPFRIYYDFDPPHPLAWDAN